MQITHQDIVDRRQALDRVHSEAYSRELDRIKKEKLSLQELCGGLGHVFAAGDYAVTRAKPRRHCVFCYHAEPEAQG